MIVLPVGSSQDAATACS